MPILLWDASALSKRYAPESGSDTVDALFATGPTVQSVATVLGYAETFSVLVRKHNRGGISASTYATAKSSLRNEVVLAPGGGGGGGGFLGG
jgi:predicted nucleic acid-binding protein